jgi:hypothetical protein
LSPKHGWCSNLIHEETYIKYIFPKNSKFLWTKDNLKYNPFLACSTKKGIKTKDNIIVSTKVDSETQK